jgi:hypothetical protein
LVKTKTISVNNATIRFSVRRLAQFLHSFEALAYAGEGRDYVATGSVKKYKSVLTNSIPPCLRKAAVSLKTK